MGTRDELGGTFIRQACRTVGQVRGGGVLVELGEKARRLGLDTNREFGERAAARRRPVRVRTERHDPCECDGARNRAAQLDEDLGRTNALFVLVPDSRLCER